MSRVVKVFLPMRAGSERVPKKNIRNFANVEGGLCKIKLEQLIDCDAVEEIFVSTDDAKVFEICRSMSSRKIKLLERPKELALSSTSTDELIKYVTEIIPDGHILWTHVTSPFINSKLYEDIIEEYFANISKFDSLMTVTKIQKFLWNDSEPLNYNRAEEKWPRTQTISPVWEVNSGAFIASREIYEMYEDRIGSKPYLLEIDENASFDIDWMSDFEIAEAFYSRSRSNRISNSTPRILN